MAPLSRAHLPGLGVCLLCAGILLTIPAMGELPTATILSQKVSKPTRRFDSGGLLCYTLYRRGDPTALATASPVLRTGRGFSIGLKYLIGKLLDIILS